MFCLPAQPSPGLDGARPGRGGAAAGPGQGRKGAPASLGSRTTFEARRQLHQSGPGRGGITRSYFQATFRHTGQSSWASEGAAHPGAQWGDPVTFKRGFLALGEKIQPSPSSPPGREPISSSVTRKTPALLSLFWSHFFMLITGSRDTALPHNIPFLTTSSTDPAAPHSLAIHRCKSWLAK